MSQTKKKLTALPLALKSQLIEKFGSLDKFYALVYLIARNEHQTQISNMPGAQQRLNTIRAYQGMIRFLLDEGEVNGKELMDDISSDYLEDFVQFKEQDFGLSDQDFISLVHKI